MDIRRERADFRPDKADIRPERTGLRSERPKEGTNEQKDGQMNEQTKVPLCSAGLRPLSGRCPKVGYRFIRKLSFKIVTDKWKLTFIV